MRDHREHRVGMFSQYAEHDFSKNWKRISELLDAFPECIDWVHKDLTEGAKPQGAHGMSAESVLRAAILKQQQQWSYKKLEFHLVDSTSARAFCRLPDGRSFSDSTLQENIRRVRAQTWESINRLFIAHAARMKIEKGRTVRVDSTVVESNIHHPTDSGLLWDCVRVAGRMVHWLKERGEDARLKFSIKKAKKLFGSIHNAKDSNERRTLYAEMIIGAGDVFRQLDELKEKLAACKATERQKARRLGELLNLKKLFSGVLAQAIERVLDGKKVPSQDKIASIFESHTDIVVKGMRDVEFGHKVFLTTGQTGLVLDALIMEGSPSDTDLFPEMMDRLKDIYGKCPRQVAADGGFASQANVKIGKQRGIKDVYFSKRCALGLLDMVTSAAVGLKLRNFRSGIESNISHLKRGFGLSCVLWRGLDGFLACVWSAIVAYNLTSLGRLCD